MDIKHVTGKRSAGLNFRALTRRDINKAITTAGVAAAFGPLGMTAARAEGSDYTLTVIDGIDVKDWDPAVAYGHESYVLNNIYDPLTRYNSAEAKLEPALATDWSVSEDGLTWTFKLREGVVFHSGEPMTSASIKAMLDRSVSMGQGAQYLWGDAQVSTPDDMTVVITTSQPLPLDLIASGSYACNVYSAAAAAQSNDWFQEGNADGAGPYKLVQWVPNQQIVLERNENYWQGWNGNEPDRIIVRIVSEVSTQLQMLQSGEADLAFSTLPFDMLDTLMQDPNIGVEVVDSWMNLFAPINTALAPTDNLKFRQALTHIMDYETVVKELYAGYATVSKGPTPMALPGAIDYGLPKFDMEMAKQLLDESGVPQDQWEISWVAYGGVDVLKNVALLFQANAGQLGIKVNIMQGDWGVMWDKQKSLDTAFNVYPFRNWPDYATINPDATFHTQEHLSYNFSYYSNPQVDAWIEEGTANEAADKEKCYAAWQSAYKQIVADAAAMWIADTQRLVVHRKNLAGIETDAAYSTVFFHGLHRSDA